MNEKFYARFKKGGSTWIPWCIALLVIPFSGHSQSVTLSEAQGNAILKDLDRGVLCEEELSQTQALLRTTEEQLEQQRRALGATRQAYTLRNESLKKDLELLEHQNDALKQGVKKEKRRRGLLAIGATAILVLAFIF